MLGTTPAGRWAAWAALAAAAAANVAGYAFDLYQRYWWFDRVLHGYTLFALTLWAGLFLCRRALVGGRSALLVLMIASTGVAAGALWEVAEWSYDRMAPGNVIKGKDDTIKDLVMDTAGALAAALACLALLRSKGAAGPSARS